MKDTQLVKDNLDQAKTLGTYWSKVEPARKLVRSYLYKRFGEPSSVTSPDELAHRLQRLKLFDPSCGGARLLFAAWAEVYCYLSELSVLTGELYEYSSDVLYGIEIYEPFMAEAHSFLSDELEHYNEPDRSHIVNSDSLETNWRNFLGEGEVLIVANPPFTSDDRLNETQKRQMKRFCLNANMNFDAAFICKAGVEKLYDGVWIVNASTTQTSGAVIDMYVHTEPGVIHTFATEGGIISAGTQPERWMITSQGSGGNLCITVSSKVRLTDWSDIYRLSPFKKRDDVKVEALTFSGTMMLNDYSECIPVQKGDIMISHRTLSDGYLRWKTVETDGMSYNTYIIHKPSAETMRLVQSRVMAEWVKFTANECVNSYAPRLARTFYSFPLSQNDVRSGLLDELESLDADTLISRLYEMYRDLNLMLF